MVNTGECREYNASDSGEPMYLKLLQSSCSAKQKLKLKIGAQVINISFKDIFGF